MLAHLPLDKMAAIVHIFSDAFIVNENVFWLIFHWSLFLIIQLTITQVQIMAWCQIGDKPLSEPMLTWFIDAYMQH